MSGPMTACLFCNRATPLVGCWGQDASGRTGELCKDCQPNRFVNPYYVQQSARAHREAVELANSPDFAKWESEALEETCPGCNEASDWSDGCSNGCE